MKRLIISAVVALAVSPALARMPQASDVAVKDFSARRDGPRLNLSFLLDLAKLPKGANNETRLTPVIRTPGDSVALRSVTVAGRNRMIQARRTGSIDDASTTFYAAGKTACIPYEASVAWEPWMQDADIDLRLENVGCCQSRRTLAGRPMATLDMGPRPFEVALEYATPVEERVKIRQEKGEAYVDFVVNRTNILPDFRNNPAELRKIRATIDSVKSDPDTRITRLSITGYASPEGPYANNERLAKGRTEALAEYVRKLYTFPADLMETAWVAEDWAGLRRRVEGSSLPRKKGILAVIDSPLEPDAKDRRLRDDFPADYQYMLANFYPALRHSDYAVEFEVRKYSDPAEIAKVFARNPSRLSLRELFIYAGTLDPRSREYADVFYAAARMYPADQTANLNAGNSALASGDLALAEAYLDKAGDTPRAQYARGVLAARRGDYAKASDYFAEAARGGVDTREAEAALARMRDPEVIVR